MSVFSDDDLKRLKIICEEDGMIGTVLVHKLLVRLEAAEECAIHLKYMEPKCRYLEAWNKSRGE